MLNLAIGEFAALLTFIFVYRLLDLGMASLVAFSYLILILLQGSAYWFYRYILIANKKRVNHKTIELYNVPIKPDKIFDNLSEPDIINDR